MSDQLRVLVLDDSEYVLEAVHLALSNAGFDVSRAQNLVEFEQALKEQRPHIVLSDLHMPDISGDNICRVLKQKMETEFIPIVLFSSADEEDLAALAEKAGADAYISKSAGLEAIVSQIHKLTKEIVF